VNTLCIIPARGGSKRLPGKNLRLLAGKPLVARAIEAALGSREIHRIAVSSDDEKILQVARSYESVLPLKRPGDLATDLAPAIEYVQHALRTLEEAGEPRFDTLVIVQSSSPLTSSEDSDATVTLLHSSRAESAVSVVQLQHAIHPLKLKTMHGDRLFPYLEDEAGRFADHDLTPIYIRNGSVYAATRETVDSRRIVGDDCRGYLMPRKRSIDINDETDLLFAEFLFQNGTK